MIVGNGVDIANVCPAARARRAGPGLGGRLFAQREHLGPAKVSAGPARPGGSAAPGGPGAPGAPGGPGARAGIRA
jgi:DNA polymerase-3 subunit gamma/tau